MTNFNCNVTSHLQLAHHFFKRMMVDQLRGCIVFTSSQVISSSIFSSVVNDQAGILPAPASALYGAGKACLSAFGANLALEGRSHASFTAAPKSLGLTYGIDVSVIQAGPMATRFADKVDKIDILNTFSPSSSFIHPQRFC